MDPVVWPIIGSIAVAAISGVALVRSSRPNAVATATAALVAGQGSAITRMDAQIAARESIIEDLRQDLDECKTERTALALEVERQGHELAAAQQSIEQQGHEIESLRERVNAHDERSS